MAPRAANIENISANQPNSIAACFLYSFLAALLISTLSFFASSAETGIVNSDDIMRLVTVRDLLSGQSWFDPYQYRLGLAEGTFMHWSRLVDAPLAAIHFSIFSITGEADLAEKAMMFLWPAITLFIALLGINVACTRLAIKQMHAPATIIGAVAFMTSGIFGVGSIDHHNIQVALAIWLIALLLPGPNTARAHAFAGIVAVLMLAVGMETLPYVTLAGAWVALNFMLGRTSEKSARNFGLALGVASLIILFATVRPEQYFAAYCDGYSFFHIAMCTIGGFGLALIAQFISGRNGRLIGLAFISGIAAVALIFLFPQCLSNPLSSLDPKLKIFWLEGVVETRSIFDLWQTDPFQLFGMFGMSMTALTVVFVLAAKQEEPKKLFLLLCGSMLIVSIIVTAWQQRGMMFSSAFAALPLAYLVTSLRTKYQASLSITDLLKMVCVGAMSLNMFWWIAGANAAQFFKDAPTLQQKAASVSTADYCFKDDVYYALSQEAKGVVLGATDIGALVLKNTYHRALAGPYHRNTSGNLLMIEAMLATPDIAKNYIFDSGVTILADCIRSADAADFKRAEPAGLQSLLHEGKIPSWLDRIEATKNDPLVLYRVVR